MQFLSLHSLNKNGKGIGIYITLQMHYLRFCVSYFAGHSLIAEINLYRD